MAHADAAHPYERLPSGTRATISSFVSSIYQSISLSFISPLLRQGAANDLEEYSAISVNPIKESVEELTNKFSQIYNKDSRNIKTGAVLNPVIYALVRQHAFLLLMHFLFTALWSCSRLFRSVAIRWFLMWLSDYKDGDATSSEGWFWGLIVIFSTVAMTMFDTHTFWSSCKSGWKMKMSMMAAIHAKLLRLNSSSVSQITAGHIVNLASNDVQRFIEAAAFWPYFILGPAESISILIMLSFVLGFVPAVSGMSCVLILVPLQSFFSRQIGHYRTKSARVTDQRINFMSELITGHLALKMLGWEDTVLEKLHGIRTKEHKLLTRMNCIIANRFAMGAYIQLVMACVTFVVYRFTSEEFNVPDVLFAISLFNLPSVFMAAFFSAATQHFSELLVSAKRLHKFFELPEVDESSSTRNTVNPSGDIVIEDGNYGWYSSQAVGDKSQERTSVFEWILIKVGWKRKQMHQQESPLLVQTLTNIGFHVKSGELVGIAGTVGSGKSSLLLALLNDMENLNPEHVAQITGSVSYCSQVPWILAATVRQNIVFGNEFDQDLYDHVLTSCALDVDIEQLPFGDQTEIGEQGINLSGGQKARIALARAAYAKADVNLLDDPLSAVDPKVGRILFEKCIGTVNGLMRDSTRLLVTHQKQFLPLCDRIIIMNKGQIAYIGTWSELSDDHLLKDMESSYASVDACLEESSSSQSTIEQRGDFNFSAESDANSQPGIEAIEESNKPETSTKQQLVGVEEKMYGRVPLRVYWEYSKFIGVVPLLLDLFIMVLGKMLHFATEWWIAAWASTDSQDQRDHKWIWVLIGLTIVVATSLTIGTSILLVLCIRGSTNLHKQMAKRVTFAPLSFFHRNPSGRILNRFSKDTGIQDDELPANVGDVLLSTLHVIGSMIVVCIALPHLIPVIILTLVGLRRFGRYYVMTAREVRRYCAITRSPVYAMLSANIKALSTVRAFRKEQEFQSAFLKALNLNGSWEIAYLSAALWAALRMDAFLIVIYILLVVLSVPLCDTVSVRLIGLALVYIVTLSGKFQWWTRQCAELTNRMTSVERNLEYTQLDQEPPRASEGGGTAPANWPLHGTIEYSLVSASYRPGLEPVLKQLQFVLPGGSSVGVVGRTGSGKSSLLLSLLRLIDIDTGRILIDGVDTSTIGIDVLRKQLSVIPQDPFLFAGTLRSNMDPWSEYSDAQVWSMLDRVHLSEACKAFGGINAPVAECGDNLSVGQRQLLCLARALLTDSKILALDEATANVDRNTDALIQDTLHALIATHEKTLLIIAHRIDTVLDCDLLLVLDGGRVAEFGSPASLLSRPEGVFKRMVEAAREATYIKSHNTET